MNEKCSVVEGLIFLSGDEGVTLQQLASSCQMFEKDVLDLIDEICEEYLKDCHGFECVNVGGRYKFISKE
ncbi:MAG: SMC-Scp complex subunit ScpB, partial [Traorella sp.]